MKLVSRVRVIGAFAVITLGIPLVGVTATSTPVSYASSGQTIIPLQASGTSSISSPGLGGNTSVQDVEVDSATQGPENGPDTSGSTSLDRPVGSTAPGAGPSVNGGKKAKSNPEIGVNFDGLNFFQQRFANGGNQFSVEPPDQGLCAGNGFVLETVNDVMRVFSSTGSALTGPVDLNTFYGYPAAINRSASPIRYGPSITDPSCYFDSATQRWFHLVLTLDRAAPTTRALAGTNHLDLAVSTTSNPLDPWRLYSLPVQNNGTQGTPDHHCPSGFCLGDYPHLGANANGIFLTTNEFDFVRGYHGAQIYAISKSALEAGTANTVVNFDLAANPTSDGLPGFTVWPATSPDGGQGNAEYFMWSTAVFTDSGSDNRVIVTTVDNTSSLNSGSPSLGISHRSISTEPYAVPPHSTQKAGNLPQQDCLNDPTCRPRIGGLGPANPYGYLDSNDSRMQQVVFANGKLWGALDTALQVGSQVKAGIAYFVLRPQSNGNGVVAQQGYLGLANNNLTYPALSVTPSGRGVMAFTVVGDDYYPSAGYSGIDAKIGAGDIHIAAQGQGPQDGFSQYRGQGSPRPRWGDYGAAAVDGNSIWIASEFIGQTCTYAQYQADLTCGGTRAPLGNWDTHISQVTP